MPPADSNSTASSNVDHRWMSIRLTDLLRDRAIRWLLLTAALVRLVIGLNLWASDPLMQVPLSDPAYYHAWASALAGGDGFRDQAPFWLPPLYPWLLSALYRVTGPAIGAVILIQSLAGIFSTVLLVLLSYRVAGRRAALAAGALWTFYAPVIFFETRLLPVTLAIPLCLAALNLLVQFESRTAQKLEASAPKPGLTLPTIAGLLIGFAAMARPNLLIAVPCIALALFAAKTLRGQRLPGLIALCFGLVLGIAPSTLENFNRSGDLIPVTANGGVNFWFGNNELAHGTFHAPSAEWGSIGTQRDVSIAIATAALGSSTPLCESEASAWWFGEGRAFLFDSPAAALRLWGLKLADTLSSTEFGIQYFPAAIRRLAPALWLGALPFGLLLALGILGLKSAEGSRVEGRIVLTSWLVAGLMASLLYFTYSRFRLPILIAWMPFAGRGLVLLIDVCRRQAKLPLTRTVLASALLAGSFVPFEGGYPRQLEANTLLDAGLAARDLDDLSGSVTLIQQSLELVPVNPRAKFELGRTMLALGADGSALPAFEAAWSMPGAYTPALFQLCQLLLGSTHPKISDPPRAVRELRRWLQTSSARDPQRLNLQLLLATGLIDNPALASSADEARALTLAILQADPNHSGALRVLEYQNQQ